MNLSQGYHKIMLWKPLLFGIVHLYIGKHFQSMYTFLHLYINAFRAFVYWETHLEQIIGTGLSLQCQDDDGHQKIVIVIGAWVTRPERPKGAKDEVKDARRAAN